MEYFYSVKIWKKIWKNLLVRELKRTKYGYTLEPLVEQELLTLPEHLSFDLWILITPLVSSNSS
jgi:hypothetical protein